MSTESQEQLTRPQRQTDYYLGLDEWLKTPEFQQFVENEFQSSPLREGEEKESPIARREFLKLMGASLAMLSGAGCIRRPVQKIVPYNKQPEEVTFGVDSFYTSTWFDGREGLPLLVKTREGRPLKYEPLEAYPLAQGLSARAHAHLLSLYDPDRVKTPKKNLLNKERTNRDTIDITWDEVDEKVSQALKKGAAAILTGNLPGPSSRQVVQDFVSAFGVKHYFWEFGNYGEILESHRLCFGQELVPLYRFDEAKLIISVDADFLGTWLMPTHFNSMFAKGRKNPAQMSELVVFDSQYSLTGANADLRFRIKPSQQLAVVLGLAHSLIVEKRQTRFAGNPTVAAFLTPFADTPARLGISKEKWNELVERLASNQGKSLVVAGGWASAHEGALSLQVATNFLNFALGNYGQTLDTNHALLQQKAKESYLVELIEQIENGSIKTLIIHGQNPCFYGPLAARFQEACKKLDLLVHLTTEWNETSNFAHYVLPDLHPQEHWDDLELVDGVYHLHQPTIRPLYDGRNLGFVLMSWAYAAEVGPKRLKELESYYDYVREILSSQVLPKYGNGRSSEAFWQELLEKGMVQKGRLEDKGGVKDFDLKAMAQLPNTPGVLGIELVPYVKVAFSGSDLFNSAWLHELPDPVTKIVWDNYAQVSLGLAEKLKIKEGQKLELSLPSGAKVVLPAHIQPGLHDEVIAVALGYGRSAVGKVGKGVGVNVLPLAQYAKDKGWQFAAQPVTLKVLPEKYPLACVQSHHAMEGRQIVIEASKKQYDSQASAGIHKHHVFSIWPGHQYNGHKWGMAVDLNVCTGCSACMVACQSENNIPVVGKKYVLQGREMHWIRVDRYYVGHPSEAETVFQPVMCQHCDNAPCETVCPVLATVHSDEGLNDMVYNRCVGTRYCLNNCPYKVRRFNWFNYTKNIEKPLHLALNPDVTVRSRGVMEKCTFCVHRIKAKRIEAKTQGRSLKDGDIKTACQQSCPTGAIVFGDLNDPKSQVAQIFQKEPRAYALLEEWNAAPSVRYLTKIRNNDDMQRPSSHH